jgi:hypothetical protein
MPAPHRSPPSSATLRNRRKTRALRAAAVTAVLLAAGLFIPGQAQGTPVTNKDRQAYEEHLSEVAQRATAASAGDAAFAGAGIDWTPDKGAFGVVVFRVGGAEPAAITSRYTRLADAKAPMRILPVLVSIEQAKVLQAAIVRDLPSLRAEGIEFQRAGLAPAYSDGAFEIGVRDADRHRETLLARYGDAFFGRHLVRVVEGNVVLLGGAAESPDPPDARRSCPARAASSTPSAAGEGTTARRGSPGGACTRRTRSPPRMPAPRASGHVTLPARHTC